MKKTKKIIMWSIIAVLAVIIALLGYFLYKKGVRAGLDLNAKSSEKLS